MHPLALALFSLLYLLSASAKAAPFSTNANRLAYLDEDNPFYPHRDFPKLITPQWVGEPGVEAVVILAIDDMREAKKYETFLRPILERLKQIDGRAPVSIFANLVTTNDTAQLQTWLAEGLSLEVHTLTHPCPLLQKGSFTNAWNTFHGCVDLLGKIPGNQPVAFRMPCCDSVNSPSPRFYAEIFNRTSPDGRFLQADSSVMCLLTDDFLKRHGVSLPQTSDARPQPPSALPTPDHFRRYFPATTNAVTKKSLANFGTYIEDYPYPYVINRTCWEFPAMVPSDWEAFNAHGPTNAATVADWQLALDAVVRAQGVFTTVFHPHGWLRNDQIIQFIDYAERTYGKKVKFLTFKEAVERLNKNLPGEQPLRGIAGQDKGVRLLDLNNDGFLDVLGGISSQRKARTWKPAERKWHSSISPFTFVGEWRLRDAMKPIRERGGEPDYSFDIGLRLGVLRPDGIPTAMLGNGLKQLGWQFTADEWVEDAAAWKGLPPDVITVPDSAHRKGERSDSGKLILAGSFPVDRGVRLRDFDRDGRCELLVSNDKQNAIFAWSDSDRAWKPLPYTLPAGVALVDATGHDNGLRFVDLNGDGFDDLLLSNEKEYAIYLRAKTIKPGLGWTAGWSHKVLHEQRTPAGRGVPTAPPDGSPKPAIPATATPTNHLSLITNHSREIPPFVRSGPHRNNGAWFARGQLFIQNEDTAHLPDNVWRKTFAELIAFDTPPPKTPAESQQCFQARPGFRVELVAAEPLVQSPVAFEWGADGKLWVVEMSDYPNGVPEHEARAASPSPLVGRGERAGVRGGGRVKFLESTHGDGRYDKATVFLDHLPFPTGVMPWRKGVIISAAPDILYAEDTDGDGKADVKKVLFTGFREGNQQHRLNGFEYGLDNWIYGANGDSGGTITCVNTTAPGAPAPNSKPETPNSKPVSISGRDFRFRPDTGEFEAIEGQTQFGRRRDDWGNWFGNNNPTWLWHYWLPDRYLRRNPHLAVKSSKQLLANYPDATRCFPISTSPIRFNQPQAVNHVTSGCSPTPYRDDLFGPAFATSVFISEPVHNLVHREVLVPDGVSFTSRRAPDEQDREFLASTDNWFRPTMLKTGPDGALYIADFYRFVLEHPEWIAPETQARLDLRAGADKGRIWRVVPVDKPLRKIPNLAKLNATELVAALDSPSGWQRDTAQRLLVERQDKAAVPGLNELLAKATNPKVRLQALCTLDGLQSVGIETLLTGWSDPHPLVCADSFRVAETVLGRAGQSAPPNITPLPSIVMLGSDAYSRFEILSDKLQLFRRTSEPDRIRIGFQWALSLGNLAASDAGHTLAALAEQHYAKPGFRQAIMSSAIRDVGTFASSIMWYRSLTMPLPTELLEDTFGLLGAVGKERDYAQVIAQLCAPADGVNNRFTGWEFGGLAQFLDAAESRNLSLPKLKNSPSPDLIGVSQSLAFILTEARAFVQRRGTNLQYQVNATRLLGREPENRAEDLTTLATLLKPQHPAELQSAAVAQLAKLGGSDSASALLSDWKSHSPALREPVLSALLARPAWIESLLTALERGQVAATQISPAQRQKLTTHPQPALRDRATKLFAATSADRAKVIKDYAAVDTLKGDAARGRELFTKNCATCHRLKNEGRELGPDLGQTATRDTDWLLTAILDPNAAVEARYLGYTAITKSGNEYSGIITAETPNNLVLKSSDGTETPVLRTDLQELIGSGLSLMPEGLEAVLKPQDLADLLAWLRAK